MTLRVRHAAPSGDEVNEDDYLADHIIEGDLVVTGASDGFGTLFSGLSGTVVGAGIKRIKTDGHTVAGIGGAEYIYDAGITILNVGVGGNIGTAFLAADGRGFKLDPAQRLTFDMFGAVPTDYTTATKPDCLPAWTAFSAWLDTQARNKAADFIGVGQELLFPGAHYRFSGTIQLKHAVHLRGYASGHGSLATILGFPANCAGIVVNRGDSLGDVGVTSTTGGDGSIIEGLTLNGGGGTLTGDVATDLLYSGIRMRGRAAVRDCTIQSFRGAGICIVAAIGSAVGNPFAGNANNWKLDTCKVYANKTGGVYVSGGDANAGTAIAVDCSYNGRFGFYDGAFLGNAYIGCHTDHNGVISNFNDETYTSLVHQSGGIYYLKMGVSLATARATTPGTNSAVWAYATASGPGGDYPQWTNTGNYVPGGSYGHEGGANACAFVGCYYETGQAPPQIGAGGLVVAGFMGPGSTDGAAHLKGSGAGMESNRPFLMTGTHANRPFVTFGGTNNLADITLLAWGSDAATPGNPGQSSRLYNKGSSGDIIWEAAPGVPAFRWTGPSTTRTFGRPGTPDNRFITEARELALGTGDNVGTDDARVVRFGSAAPTSGPHAKGEIVFNNGDVTSIATTSFWHCSVAGTPGTWVAK